MVYTRNEHAILARLDPGDEIVEQVLLLAEKEHIQYAAVSAIGATDDFTVGVFDLELNDYHRFTFTGNHEIIALQGNLSRKDGAPYQHLHITCADREGHAVGGHLMRGRISLTCEITLQLIDIAAERRPNPELGINQLTF